MTELESRALYLHDAELREVDGVVIAVDHPTRSVALDRTVFYPAGGGQPHDTGALAGLPVVAVTKRGGLIWHQLGGDVSLPAEGAEVHAELSWDRRYALMRTHSAAHVLCGVVWREWGIAVTGGNMTPLAVRMDFEFDPLPADFGARVEDLTNAEIAADRRIEVSFLPRGTALQDHTLIRTKLNLVPPTVTTIRVVDIVGLDRQADGGTHVRSTSEIGSIAVVKTESKGKGNKRIRIEVKP